MIRPPVQFVGCIIIGAIGTMLTGPHSWIALGFAIAGWGGAGYVAGYWVAWGGGGAPDDIPAPHHYTPPSNIRIVLPRDVEDET